MISIEVEIKLGRLALAKLVDTKLQSRIHCRPTRVSMSQSREPDTLIKPIQESCNLSYAYFNEYAEHWGLVQSKAESIESSPVSPITLQNLIRGPTG